MNKAKRILTTTGYTTQLEKSIVLSYIEELEQKVNQLEQDRIHLIEIISGLISYVKNTYNEDLTDKTAEAMEMVLNKVGGSNG